MDIDDGGHLPVGLVGELVGDRRRHPHRVWSGDGDSIEHGEIDLTGGRPLAAGFVAQALAAPTEVHRTRGDRLQPVAAPAEVDAGLPEFDDRSRGTCRPPLDRPPVDADRKPTGELEEPNSAVWVDVDQRVVGLDHGICDLADPGGAADQVTATAQLEHAAGVGAGHDTQLGGCFVGHNRLSAAKFRKGNADVRFSENTR